MKNRTRVVRQMRLSVRIQQLTGEIEKLVPDVKASLGNGHSRFLASASKSLERAATAVRALADHAPPSRLVEGDFMAALEGTSSLMSLLGSRVVLARTGSEIPRRPSAGAQALALLLEDPKRTYEAAEIAERLDCSVPIARTTLNRLVQSGHATRAAAGRFRAKAR